MKRAYIFLIAVMLLFASCKEKDPIVNFSNVKATENTYVLTSVPAADPHNVLVEEFTGQDCSNCPPARYILDTLENQNPERINTVGLYISNFPQTIPPAGSIHDFRSSVATAIGGIYGGIGGMPVAGIDRGIDIAIGNMQAGRGDWPGMIGSQLAITDSVNLSVKSSYNTTTGLATIIVNVTYLQTTSAQQYISIYIVEDSMVDLQEMPDNTIDPTYLFMNVCRDIVTAQPFGDVILPNLATKVAGRTDQITYNYKFNPNNQTPAWLPQHCRVVAFIANASTNGGRVLQSAQTKLAP